MKKIHISKNPSETKKAGRELAQRILAKKFLKKAFVIALKGELGSGKTTFLQGFAQGLGIKERVLSPTFIICKNYQLPITNYQTSSRFQIPDSRFYHIDCYRLKKPEDIFVLGFKKIISNPKNIIAIEWAEKIKKTLPKNLLWVRFNFINEKKRKITYNF